MACPRMEDCPKYFLYDDLTKKWYSLPEATYALMQRWKWTATLWRYWLSYRLAISGAVALVRKGGMFCFEQFLSTQ